jgi:molecular chaperone HtpG
MLLKGVLDCPDLPLNVSRSFLQNDGYVNKISTHITKKVADKLTSIYENDRENFNKYWDDINPFVKYGCIREVKFYDRVKDIVIYKTTKGDYVSQKEYLERNKEKHENKVFYVSDERQQAQYIKLFKDNGMEAVILSTMIDNHFISFLESKQTEIKFSRIDSDLSESLKEKEENIDENASKELQESFEKLFKDALGNEKLKLKVESLKSAGVPGMILLDEHSRRMQEMSARFGGFDMSHMFGNEETLVLNKNNNLIKKVINIKDKDERKDEVKLICEHIYDLAMMSHKQLSADAMTKFIERSNMLLTRLVEE